MNFKYTNPDDPQGQGLPPGFPPGMAFIMGGNQPPQNPEDAAMGKLNQQQLADYFAAKTRMMFAQARNVEMKPFFDALHEMRTALDTNSLTVGEDDRGSTNRPPLVPALREDVRMKVQMAYLRMTERVMNYCEDFMKRELQIELTNEIKSKPHRDGLHERSGESA